ncbi:MAG TPA: glycosyltransferase family 2 protein [Cyclobacteriaceae bacterium]|nr:glycosyltransferase family 2 protein [Cyclobacteriaceae bacterium]
MPSNTPVKTLSVLIPVYNEEKTILAVLDAVRKVELSGGIRKQIIVINDGSTDRTGKIIEQYFDSVNDNSFLFIQSEKNEGKGASIRKGIVRAEGEFLIIQDADLEYDPREYNILLQPVLDGHADVVYGSRFRGSQPHRILFFWHTIGNKFLTQFSNMFTNLNLTDMETCYKLINTSIATKLTLRENRFGFEPEITAKISRVENVRIYEVGISYYGRKFKEGKKINWKDGVHAVWCILKYNLFG